MQTSTTPNHGRICNFAAGPAALPVEVLEEAQKDLLNFKGCGRSIVELSHRSKIYEEVQYQAEKDLRTLMKIPDNYKVLFMQGGGTGQFAAVPLNLLRGKNQADYIVSGTWSKKAQEEATKYCDSNIASNCAKDGKFREITDPSTWKLSPESAYLYYCSNETVDGVEFQEIPHVPGDTILVADMSSNFLSKPVDVSKHALIYAGAQKNSGIAGVTVVIVREDLLYGALPVTPTVLNYKITSDNKSLFNTPPTFAVYVAGLTYKWILAQGGLGGMEKRNLEKATKVYQVLDSSDFWRPCVEKKYRSRMNVTLRLKDEKLEAQFLKEAAEHGFIELAGHRSVGGIRISLYNAVSVEAVDALVEFMNKFQAKYQ